MEQASVPDREQLVSPEVDIAVIVPVVTSRLAC